MKKLLKIKIIIIVALAVSGLFFLVAIVAAVTGTSLVVNEMNKQMTLFQNEGMVTNNAIYSAKYTDLLNKYLYSKGYVTLERLVFYLQRTHNILDVSTLSFEEWESAYLNNIDENEKQMIPIKWVCKDFKVNSSLPEYTIHSDFVTRTINEQTEQFYLDKIDLCNVEKKDEEGNTVEIIDVTESLEYQDGFVVLPYSFPFLFGPGNKITSYVFAQRRVGIVSEGYSYHNGWDIAEPIGTKVYSVCDGYILNIVNTQQNNLNYNEQQLPKNDVGNYVEVMCDNNLIVEYYHLYYNSVPFPLGKGSKVYKGQLLTKTSTTGLSTGPHLHLGLKTTDGTHLDIMRYIDLKTSYIKFLE